MSAKKKSNAELAAELTTQLKFMRSLVREAGEGFIQRREGEIETLIGYLSGTPDVKLHDIAPVWLRDAANLNVKPSKGRLKDLKNIDSLLEDLLDGIVELQHICDIAPSRKKQISKNRAAKKQSDEPSGESVS